MTDGLLLLHAWPIDARMWEPQLAALPEGLPVAAPNLPGFGGSEPAGDVLTMGLAAERAIGAMGERGIDRVVVCGLSMGGYVAFEVWRRARDRVLGLVLANTRAVADSPEAAAGRRALAERLRSEGNVLIAEPPARSSGRGSTAGSPNSRPRRSPRPCSGWPNVPTRPPTSRRSTCPPWC